MNEILETTEIKTVSEFNSVSSFINWAFSQPYLEEEKEAELLQRLANDAEDADAFAQLFNAFLRLVISQARKYSGYGAPMEDLIQEGCVGLIKAIRKFDTSHKTKFATYAIPWVSSEILEFSIRNFSIVKSITTKEDRKLFFNLNRIKKQFAMDGELSFSLSSSQVKQVAAELDVSEEKVRDIEVKLAGDYATKHTVNRQRYIEDGDEESFEMLSMISDTTLAPEFILEQHETEYLLSHRIHEVFSQLDDREQKIIKSRWMNDDKINLTDLGAEFGVSAERVRQIESKALKTLRSSLQSYNPF
jgi:RNA polymerase sigma-32 factor